ncbi:MAG TPA: ATP-dependent DNA ligase, partial [Terriglobales bacterium]|nr:ATP-dependent DNA ligase [Terriglobales bacterium]
MPKRLPKTGLAKTARVKAAAIPAQDLAETFPPIALPIKPPYPSAEAKSVAEVPQGPGWLYEPKWDGFRCLAFRAGKKVLLQSKAGQPLGRYFPEMVAALSALPHQRFVLDGEIVIFSGSHLSFDNLLMRIHPAQSRIRKLATETPATMMCFDLLVDSGGKLLTDILLSDRRQKLEEFFADLPTNGMVRLSPASKNPKQAEKWMHELARMGLDGIVAKRLDEPYRSGERTAMVKIKRIRTADCVVGGFR